MYQGNWMNESEVSDSKRCLVSLDPFGVWNKIFFSVYKQIVIIITYLIKCSQKTMRVAGEFTEKMQWCCLDYGVILSFYCMNWLFDSSLTHGKKQTRNMVSMTPMTDRPQPTMVILIRASSTLASSCKQKRPKVTWRCTVYGRKNYNVLRR